MKKNKKNKTMRGPGGVREATFARDVQGRQVLVRPCRNRAPGTQQEPTINDARTAEHRAGAREKKGGGKVNKSQ